MDIKVLTPVQIFINNKFYCVADMVEIKRNSPEFRKSILPNNPKANPNEATGTAINIIRSKRIPEEKKAVEEERKKGTYDEFYNRMVNAIDDPEAHIPVDISDL